MIILLATQSLLLTLDWFRLAHHFINLTSIKRLESNKGSFLRYIVRKGVVDE